MATAQSIAINRPSSSLTGVDLIAAHERAMVEVERELGVIGEEIVQAASDYLDEHRINVDGDIKKSLYQEVERAKDALKLTVGAGAKHAIFVHDGTKPHFPPLKPLLYWVEKKLNVLGRISQVSFSASGRVRRGETTRSRKQSIEAVARAIQWKISQHGTPAKPFLDVPFQMALKEVQPRIEAAYVRGFNGGVR